MINYNKIGLNIYNNFISDEEHSALIQEMTDEFSKNTTTRYINRNKVLRYGDKSMCENYHVSPTIPPNIDKICDKLVNDGVLKYKPDTININEYLEGDFIGYHIDRVASGPIVTILSLNSPAKIVFTNNKETFDLILMPKMLIQMRDSIRWHWSHSIAPVENTRYSIVFRNKFDA